MENTPETVIWLAGMPRSGSTWLSQIFASSPQARLKFCPLFSYEFKNKLDETALADDWAQLFHDTYHRSSEYLDQEYLRKKGLVPTFEVKDAEPPNLVIKSTRFHNLVPHILALHSTIKFVHLARDPRASIHSWLTNPYEFPKDADPMTEWRSGACRKTGPGEFWGFEDWKFVNGQALALQAQYPDRFRIVQYEDLTADLEPGVQTMFDFCGLPYHHQTKAFLTASRSTHLDNKRSVFKKPVPHQSWKGKLDHEIAEACLHEVQNTPLKCFLRD